MVHSRTQIKGFTMRLAVARLPKKVDVQEKYVMVLPWRHNSLFFHPTMRLLTHMSTTPLGDDGNE